MEKCPCENCVCVAICKTKNFQDLVIDCQLIDNFTEDPTPERMRRRVVEVYDSLKPSGWKPLRDI